MKVLVINGDCVTRNSSANLCHMAYIRGLVNLGYEVTLLSADPKEYDIVTENNEDALYEGIKKMLITPDLLKAYAAKAKERGKAFSTEKTVKAVEEMLSAL